MNISLCSKGYLAALLVEKVLMMVPGGKRSPHYFDSLLYSFLESRKKNIYLSLV